MKRVISLLFFSLVLNPQLLFSKVDSVDSEIKKCNKLLLETAHDSTKVRLLIKLSELTLKRKGNVSEKYALHALKVSKNLKPGKFLGLSYYNLADVYIYHYRKDLAIDNIIKGLQVFEKLKDQYLLHSGYIKLGNYYYDLEIFQKAIDYYKKALPYFAGMRDKKTESSILNNIGTCYQKLSEYKNALLYLKSSLKIYEQIDNRNDIAETRINIGNVYYREKDITRAIQEYEKALPVLRELQNKTSEAICLNGLAIAWNDLNQPQKAIPLCEKSIQIFSDLGYPDYLSIAYYNFANSYMALGDYKKANIYLNKHIDLNDSLSNKYLADQIAEMSEKYEADKNQQEIELLKRDKKNEEQKSRIKELDNLKQQAELATSNSIFYFTIGGLVLLIILAVILIYRIRLKSIIFKQLKKQKEEILSTKEIIEEKNNNILDSIHYAKKIQDAILHEENKALINAKELFVLFKPKDIVSGDFYWSLEKGNVFYAAVADCTGHGVPGAFMSMLGIAFLNEITKSGEIKSPADILNELREKVIRELGQTGTIGGNKDGMDISLIKLNRKNRQLEFSGAHNSLLISRNNEIIQLNADKQPIGFQERQRSFTNCLFDLKNGDSIYLLSDGYADQFGGPPGKTGNTSGKKFKINRFKEMLLQFSTFDMQTQKMKMEKIFSEWKGDMEQVDDVCVMGIKI